MSGCIKKVWVVELRERTPALKLVDIIECSAMHVASSREKAIEWAQGNLDVAPKRRVAWWWWAVYGALVDNPDDETYDDLTFVDWNGMVRRIQPLDGYEEE